MTRSVAHFSRTLDWNLLKTFHEIVQSAGVSRAGKVLARKQPAVSLALKRLEERLGVSLCVRGPGGFELTEKGAIVADTCRALSSLVQKMPQRVVCATGEVCGRVTIKVISSLVCDRLDSAIGRFHARYPKAEIAIDITTWDAVAEALLRDEIDIGIAPARNRRPDLKYDFLFDEVHQPYCGRTHSLFGQTFLDPAALAREAFVLTGADEPDQLTAFRNRYGLGKHVAGCSEHLGEAMRLVLLGIGICFLPVGFAEGDVKSGRLWPLLERHDDLSMPVYVITNPRALGKLPRKLLLAEIADQASPTKLVSQASLTSISSNPSAPHH